MTPATTDLSTDYARTLLFQALTANRTGDQVAGIVADALVAAEIDGQTGHGLARGAAYARQARSGKVNGFVEPQAKRPRPGFAVVDAAEGFAYPALALARRELAELAAAQGIACAAVTNSHHCGVLGHQVEALAEAGLLAIMVANAPKAMAPWGGAQPIYGTNPIAFAAPRLDGPPLVIDLSLSIAARGKVMAAAKTGTEIPQGWALDNEGNPTTDPKAALSGSMLPAGGSKGAALALMVEILAGALAGPHYSFEATDFFEAEGAAPALGQFMIAIAPEAREMSVTARIETLLAEIAGQDGTRLPGERRMTARLKAERQGLTVPTVLIDELRDLGRNHQTGRDAVGH